MNTKKNIKIYERNPDTGEIREREFNDFTGETVKIIHDKKPEDYGTAKMIPAHSPDAPWIDEFWSDKDTQLLNEDKNDEQEDRQLSIPFE